MMRMTCALATLSLLYCGGAAAAAGTDGASSATRYIDAQGVEIIQNRAKPAPPATAPVSPAPKVSSAARDPGWQIGATEQAERDRDRLDILKQELADQVRLYESVMKSLAGVAGKTTEAPDQARLYRNLHEYQKNIQSLNAEIRRLPGSR